MKNIMKKIAASSLCVIMAISMTACGFSVGTSNKNEDYKDLFPDAAANLDGNYKTSNLGYKFSLGEDYGEMMVYVDTSKGHKFELLESDPPGFTIQDADGNVVLYAACINDEAYEEYTQRCTEIKTINGRDFLYCENSDGSADCFSNMSDCGLGIGMVLEIHDGDLSNFGLVAFRGEPLPGSSSTVTLPAGAGTDDMDETGSGDVSVDTDDTTVKEDADGSLSYVGGDVEKALAKLDTDFAKIKWGVTYNMSDSDYEGIVISVTPTYIYDEMGLVVGITNLYDKAVSFSGNAEAKGEGDSIVGDAFIYEPCIGPANTAITYIPCSEGASDGRIHWSDVEIGPSYDEYVAWEADYSGKGNPSDGEIDIAFDLYAAKGEAFRSSFLTALIIDSNGYVLGYGTNYTDDVAAGEHAQGEISIYNDEQYLSKVADVALFANPVKAD